MPHRELIAAFSRPLVGMLMGSFVALMAMGTTFAAEHEVAEESRAETSPPFGGSMNVEYARALWDRLIEHRLVGPDSIRSFPYEGNHPHGQALEYLEDEIEIGDHRGMVMVKKNYASEDDLETLKSRVLNEREKVLDSITVMFQREKDYDPDHDNWYWAKFKPDGQLETNPKDQPLAGRVAKGADKGCIACHAGAPNEDYVFTHDRVSSVWDR